MNMQFTEARMGKTKRLFVEVDDKTHTRTRSSVSLTPKVSVNAGRKFRNMTKRSK